MRRAVAIMALIAVTVSLTACKGPEPMTFEELLSYDNAIAHVRASDVESLSKGMSYREIVTRLGATRDVGSGLHVAVYVVDDKENLYLSLVDPDEVCAESGTELLQGAQPIVDESDKIGIRGVVTDIVQGKDGITMLVEGELEQDTCFDKASVTVNMKSTVLRDNTPIAGLFTFSEIKNNDTVEVTFNGPVAESYPVQGVAATVRIVTVP
ncbi:MAG: DUF3221 domain-containing protein [Caldiserica bacterium]|jgi:hypothetical protein|nr:DUF3221 domain-containing protein [Caldisericota bacterium]